MRAFIVRMFRHPVAKNAFALYAVRVARQLLPLVTIPYLARVLGPETLGLVILSQAFALWLVVMLEYGFVFSATRDVANLRHSEVDVSRVVRGVLGAKVLLVLLSAIVTLCVFLAVPSFSANPKYVAFAWLYAVGLGFSPMWYFQGTERMGGIAVLDLAARVLATIGIFVFVSDPSTGWLVLALYGLCSFGASILATAWMYGSVTFGMPTLAESVQALVHSWNMFVFRGAVSLYTTANAFLLGLFAPTNVVAFYGGAEKLARGSQLVLGPISEALFPHMSRLANLDVRKAATTATWALVVLITLCTAISAAISYFAPLIIATFLGAGYEQAVPLLRIMSWSLPLVAIGNVLGIQWMLALALERQFNLVILLAGIFSIVTALLTIPAFGAHGLAWIMVASELLVAIGLNVTLIRNRAHPLGELSGLLEASP